MFFSDFEVTLFASFPLLARDLIHIVSPWEMPEELNIKFIFIFCVCSYFTGTSLNNINCLKQTIISSWHEFFVCYRIFRIRTLLFTKLSDAIFSSISAHDFSLSSCTRERSTRHSTYFSLTFDFHYIHNTWRCSHSKNFRRFPRKMFPVEVFFLFSLKINKRTWRKEKGGKKI